MFLSVFLICALLGSFVGFCAGLLGIGGGLIIVPFLLYLLSFYGVATELALPMALATSLASIVITSSAAAWAHHKNHNIPWEIARSLVASVALGAILGAFIADVLSLEALTLLFSVSVFLLALYMFMSVRIEKSVALPNAFVLSLIGLFTGILASLMGIAGGAILVPILTYCSLSMRHAIGVATACGIVVAFFGALGYIITGFNEANLPNWSVGYIYLPALFGITLTSSLLAPKGVQFATRVPARTLKKYFAIFLMLVAIKMMF